MHQQTTKQKHVGWFLHTGVSCVGNPIMYVQLLLRGVFVQSSPAIQIIGEHCLDETVLSDGKARVSIEVIPQWCSKYSALKHRVG